MEEIPVKADAVAQHYDDLDEFYRDVWGEHLHHGIWLSGKESPEVATRNLVDLVVQKSGVGVGSKVVDVGCGYGGTSHILAADFGCQVTGYTLSPKQFEFANQHKGHPSIQYRLQDWLDNELPDQSQDGLIAIESTEHMPSLERCLKQISRVLKPGKRAVICAWLTSEEASPRAKKMFIEPICREGRMYAMRTATDFARVAREFGLKVQDIEDFSQTAKRSWRVGASRVMKGVATKSNYRRFLSSAQNENRVFAATVVRIMTAYEVGVMRYGMLTLSK